MNQQTVRHGLLGAAVLVTGLVAAPSASAADVGVDLHGGSLGFGLGLDVGLGKHLGLRAGFNRFQTGEEWEDDDLDYEANLEFESVYGLIDWHPFGGTFRLSTGVMSTDHRIEGAADVEAGDEIGDGEADRDGRLEAEVEFDGVSPYLGVGWDWRFSGSNLALQLDVGVLAQGNPDVELRETVTTGASDDDLDEAEREIESEWSDFDTYPVVQFGLVYRF